MRRLQAVKMQTVGIVKGVKGVKKRLFLICSQKTPIKQLITICEGCEGEV